MRDKGRYQYRQDSVEYKVLIKDKKTTCYWGRVEREVLYKEINDSSSKHGFLTQTKKAIPISMETIVRLYV
jgi:hypothetical protein